MDFASYVERTAMVEEEATIFFSETDRFGQWYSPTPAGLDRLFEMVARIQSLNEEIITLVLDWDWENVI